MADQLILTENYATDPEIAGRAIEHVMSIWRNVVDDRIDLDSRMMQFYNIWSTIFDIRYYEGRSQVYSPQLRKNVEFAIRNMRRNLFPTDDYFTIDSADSEEQTKAEKLKRFLLWQQVNKIKVKRYVTPFLRQLMIYGWSPIKVVWNEQTKKIFVHENTTELMTERMINPLSGQEEEISYPEEVIKQVQKEVHTHREPTFLPIDVFSFYIYPATCWDTADAIACLEEVSFNKQHLKDKREDGTYENVDELLKMEPGNFNKRWQSKERRLETLGVGEGRGDKKTPIYRGVEYWGKFDLKGDGKDIDCTITIAEDIKCLQVRQNTFYDQEPPYLVAKLDEMVGDFYGKGLIEPLQTLQYLLNDEKNELHDAMIYSLAPILKYDPGAVVDTNSLVIAPGAMWAMRDIDAAGFERPPEVAQSGWVGIAAIQSEIDDYPGFERIPSTGRRPATQVQAIQQDRGISILDWSENVEVQVMTPFIQKQHMLNQQFLDDETYFKVTGKPPERMSPEDLIGNYHFYWMGANQTQNLIVKSRQMIDFLNIALAIPPNPGEQIDFSYIAKRIWQDGMGLDGVDKLYKSISIENMMTPDEENMLMMMGKQVPVNEMDNDDQHIQSHMQLMRLPMLDEYKKSVVEDHIKAHMAKKQRMMMLQPKQGPVAPMAATGEPADQQGAY